MARGTMVPAWCLRPGKDTVVFRDSYGRVTSREWVMGKKLVGESVTLTMLNPRGRSIYDWQPLRDDRTEIL